jgi:predicted ATPase
MYLKKIHIKYFRCFKDYEVEFAPHVTILFGKNGSGKSTLIHAIHKALSFVFKRNTSDEKGFDLTSGFSELKVEQYTKTDGVRDPKTGFLFPYVEISACASFQGTELDWDMYASTSTFSLQPSKYDIAHKTVIKKINETNTLPFFAYYSDSFPHIPKPKSITQQQMELRNLGYLDWNQESACSELWISRLKDKWTLWDRADRNVKHEENALRNCESMLKGSIITKEEYDEDVLLHKEKLQKALTERGKYDEVISEIKSCLIKFSKGDSNYEVTDIFDSIYEEDGLCLETKQGDNPPFHILPAGYKRMYYIVLDIAYRSYVLNRNTNPSGIVIIDEIDLHLHPELEQAVLERFMNTFPNLQFIVSTHSPLVLTGLETKDEQNVILRMEANTNKPEVWHDIHGIDYNLMLEENMGVQKRKPAVQALFDEAWKKISDKQIAEAKAIVEELEGITPSDQSELVRLRSMIKRLEVLGR